LVLTFNHRIPSLSDSFWGTLSLSSSATVGSHRYPRGISPAFGGIWLVWRRRKCRAQPGEKGHPQERYRKCQWGLYNWDCNAWYRMSPNSYLVRFGISNESARWASRSIRANWAASAFLVSSFRDLLWFYTKHLETLLRKSSCLLWGISDFFSNPRYLESFRAFRHQ